MFDALRYADALTLQLDLAERGLHLTGFLKVKPDSDAAKSIAEARTGEIAALGKMPTGSMVYTYMNVGAKTFDRLQGMNLKMIAGAGKPSPELEKAIAELHAMGRFESIGSMSMDKGMLSITEVRTGDPKKYLENKLAVLRAMAGGEG